MKTKLFRLAAALATVVCFDALIPPAQAQYRAGIQGVVVDAKGALVPGATVTLTSLETNISRGAETAGDGVFTISSLAPGRYSLTVEKNGFKKKVVQDVIVAAEQMQSLTVSLEVGEVTQSVTVTEVAAPALNTETANIAGTLTSTEIHNLPAFARDPYQLLRLTPGVFGDGSLTNGGGSNSLPGSNIGGSSATSSIFQVENGPQFVANGARQNSNGFQVDGVGVNSAAWGGAAVITPNEESVKEVTIVANSYSAENGRNSGAQVQVVSQNGTNELHGSAFFKWHRPGLNAYQAWNGPGSPSPVAKDENRFNQFGGSLGGPIVKNRIFGFFSYETLRNNSMSQSTGWYATPQFYQSAGANGSIARKLLSFPGETPVNGTFISRSCASVGLPSTQCRDTAHGLDLGSPLTTALGTADPTYGQPGTPYGIGSGFDGVPDVQYLETQSPTVNTNSQYNGRIDYQVTSKDLVAFSIYWVPVYSQFYNGPAFPANLWNHSSLAQSWTGMYTHTFSATVLNEARFGASGWKWNEITSNPQEPWGLPTDYIDGIGSVGVQNFGAAGPSVFNQMTYDARDTLSVVHGSHYLKFGGDVSWVHFLDEAPWSARPTYNFRNLWSFANDAPYHENGNFDPVTGQPTMAQKNLRYSILAFFAQDDWKVRPNLTLNLGLRWEDFTPLTEANGNISNPILGTGMDALTGLKMKKGGDLYNNRLTNFEPQLGFAWSPTSVFGRNLNSRMVVRGGFGIAYNAEQLAITSNGRFNPPFLTSFDFYGSNILYSIPANVHQFNNWPVNPQAIQQFSPVNGLPTSGAPVSLNGISTYLPIPVTYRYSLDMQYDLGHSWVMDLGYQGSQTRHYGLQSNLNWVFYPALNPMVQNLNWYTNDANAHHDALLAEISRRFSSSFEIDAQYALSRTVDDGSQDYYIDNYLWNRSYAVGPSDFNATHNFKLWGVWTPAIFKGTNSWLERMLGGWSLSGIFTAHTGFPWSPQYCNTGGNVVYPNSGDSCLYPAAYTGGAGTNYSNSTFMTPSGNFPKGALAYLTVPTYPAAGIPPAPAASIHRNMFTGPGFIGDDVTLGKTFGLPGMKVLGEGAALNLQANFYNLFNRLNLTNVNNTISYDGLTSNPLFGMAQGALAGRIIELQARFSF
jgi:hypothetical protein